jgi:small conductance mechanosensitive channel
LNWNEIFHFEDFAGWMSTHGLRIVFIVIAAFIVVRLSTFITRRVERMFEDADPDTMSERERQAATLGKVLRNLIRLVVWGIALITILRELGIDIAPLLAGVGIAGLAIGFGAQSLVKDILAGIFVLAEDQYNVGDVIKAAGVSGLVEKVTLRATILRDLEGNVHTIPNGVIDVVTNMTKHWSRSVLDVGVAYKEDVDEVMDVLREIGDGLEKDPKFARMITGPLEVLGVQDLADSAVVVRVMFTTVPNKQWPVAREFRRRIKKTFDEKGIEIPFPHQTIYLGEGAPMDGRLPVELAGEPGAVAAGSPGARDSDEREE